MYSSIQIWDLETDRMLHKPTYLECIKYHYVALSPDGQLLASALAQSSVRICYLASGAIPLQVHGNNDFNCVILSLDRQKLTTVAENRAVMLSDPVSGAHLQCHKSISFL